MHSGKIYISGLSDDIKYDTAENVSCCNEPSNRSATQLLVRLQLGRKPRCEGSRGELLFSFWATRELMSDSRNYVLSRTYEGAYLC